MSFKQTLTNLFGHNAVKKALIWVLVVAVAVIVVVTQFAFPVKAQYAYTRLYSYSGQSFDNMIKNVYEQGIKHTPSPAIILSPFQFILGYVCFIVSAM